MAERPNILLIMTDEHHRDVAGFAGDPIVQTPHLDSLAARGVRFDHATCANPVCTPSRMTMLTSLESHRCAAWSNHWVIFPELLTWPEHFAANGYRTCLVGKMHFGGRDQMQGFQHRPYGDLRHGLGHQPDPLHMYPGYAQARSAGISEIPESLMQDVVVTRETLAYLLEHQDQEPDTPWFVCASYGRPHAPLTAPGRYLRRYQGEVPSAPTPPDAQLEPFAQGRVHDETEAEALAGREAYYACVDFVDDCIGELLAGLEEAGLLDNCIVIYTSDHGEMLGLYDIWGKQIYYEASVAVPLVIALPGGPAGQAVNQPVSLLDLFPTTCALAGIPVPDGLDGYDLSPLLNDPESAPSPRRFSPSACYRYGVRINHGQTPDDAPHSAWRCVQDSRWKYVAVEGGTSLLFDMANDPLESTNLAQLPEHAERCEEMRAWLFERFSWEEVHTQLAADRERLPAHLSGLPPGTPNQYQLPDGRIFNAEEALYNARWLAIPPGANGGIIPQQFG